MSIETGALIKASDINQDAVTRLFSASRTYGQSSDPDVTAQYFGFIAPNQKNSFYFQLTSDSTGNNGFIKYYYSDTNQPFSTSPDKTTTFTGADKYNISTSFTNTEGKFQKFRIDIGSTSGFVSDRATTQFRNGNTAVQGKVIKKLNITNSGFISDSRKITKSNYTKAEMGVDEDE